MNILVKYFLILLVFPLLIHNSYAQSARTLKLKEEKLKKQIEETKSLLNQTKKSQTATLNELNLINNQIKNRLALINNINAQVEELTKNIEENNQEINTLTKELDQLTKEFKEMIRFAYKQRNNDYNLMYILSSDDANKAFRRAKYIAQYSESRKLQAIEIDQTQKKLEKENMAFLKNKAEKMVLIEESKQTALAYEKDKEQQQLVLKKLNSNQESLSQKLQKQEREKEKLAKAIKDAIEKEIAKSKKTSPTKTGFALTPEEAKLGSTFEANKGKLPWPVEKGTITSKYGKQPHSVIKTTFVYNNGIDISTNKNAEVRTVFDGVVSAVIPIEGSGILVLISHGSYRSAYSNLKDVKVKEGQKVSTKQVIGSLIANSSGTISESHFEIWQIIGNDTKPVNPSLWLLRN